MDLPITRRSIGATLVALLILTSPHANAAVGRTPGSASVTPDGAAAYTVPLALPPGTNGMTPVLSLEYRHRAPGDLLGIGWSLGGLSQIARCPRTIAQDGIASLVTQTADDRFCLAGQRLVVVNGLAYGAAGAEYRTEIESYARIRSFAGVGADPQYFVVEASDGRMFEYGATADSRIDTGGGIVNPASPARVWALNRIRDRSGNVIDFGYFEDSSNGSFRITSIRYNSNPAAGVAPSHQVALVYANRPSNEIDTAYVAGMPIRQVVRLERIDVLYNGAVLRRYKLAYEPALSTSGRSRLASVQECGVGGTDCYAPTIFTWQNGKPGFGAVSAVAAATPTLTGLPEHSLWNVADINGDGRDDYVWAGGSSINSATIRYRFGLADGAFGPEINTGIACPYGIGTPFDRDGDARADLLMISAARLWTVVPGGANGFGAPVATSIPLPAQLQDYRGVDLNGDSLGDIVWSEIYAYTDNSLIVQVRYALPGGGYAAMPVTLYTQAEAVGYDTPQGGQFIGRPGRRIDLDGDGAEDLLMNENYTIARISATMAATDSFDSAFTGAVVFDFNGDGCSDFAYKHYTGTLRVRIGGCGVPWSGPELLGPATTDPVFLEAHDWNSDGREDLLLRGATNWRVALSNGNSVAAITDTGIARDGSTMQIAADADGDGLRDLVTRAAGQFRLRLRNGPQADLLLAATDGLGVGAQFTYRPLTDPGVYTRGTGAIYPVQDLQTAAQVVSQLDITDGTGHGSMLPIRYRYEGLRQHLLGRGLLGFEKLIREEPTPGNGLRAEEVRRQDFPYTGLPSSVILRQESGLPVRASTWQWSALNLGTGPATRRFPYASSSTTRSYEVGGIRDGTEIASVARGVATIDSSSGLVTDETTTVTEIAGGANAGSSTSIRAHRTSVINDIANWCLGRPQGLQLTASHTLAGGAAITRSINQSWDTAKCRPTQQQLEPGNSQWQVNNSLGYDAFGNIASYGMTGVGMSPRTTNVDWGARGQRPTSIRNPLAETTQFSWNLGSGIPLAMTDPNSLTVGWSYDTFGTPVFETQPDGTSTAWTRAACTNGCDSRARIRVTQQDRDNTGVTRVTSHLDLDQHERGLRYTAQRPGGGMTVMTADSDRHGRTLREYLPFWEGSTPSGYWQFSYDTLGRLTHSALHSASSAVERSVSLSHDGLTATQTDALGHTSTGIRTAWGRLTQVIDAAGNSARYEYDAFGNLSQVRDALNNVVSTIGYNARGMKLSQTDLDMGAWIWTRNALGETTALRDAKNQSFSFTYDLLGRITSRVAPGNTSTMIWGSSPAQQNIGQLVSLAGTGYLESHTYDAFSRPASRTIATDASYRYDYAYNTLGLLDSMTYPSTGSATRFKVGYEYDAGQLSRISDADAPTTTYWRLNTLDAAGHVIDESLGATVRVVTGFDPLSGAMDYRQAGVGNNTAIQNLSYAWDDNDNLIRREDLNRGLAEEFRYDGLDRLDESRRNGAINLDLDYDAIGNIRWKSDVCPGTTPCYGYHATRKHAVTTVAGQVYNYDANGNMTSRGGAAIGWSSDNLPVSIAGAGGNSSLFSYGPVGNRWRQIARHSGTTETTIYAGELTEKVTRAGITTWRQYVLAPTGVAALRVRNAGGSTSTLYLTHDHLGSTDRIVDAAGNSAVVESFSAFGQRRGTSWTGPPTALELRAIGAITRDGFTGHEHLDNLDLIHMNGRVYDPRLGRFISADPYVTAPFDGQSLNRYAYVWNNPLGFIDPSGFDGEAPCMQTQQGNCAQITVIGSSWLAYFRYVGGAGFSQMESASQRDPCGQDSSALACAMQSGRFVSPSSIVLTAGTTADSTLAGGSTQNYLQGAAARLGNIAISSSPVTWLFGANPDFEWFDVPDSAAGQAGAMAGNIGYFIGGAAGIVRNGGSDLLRAAPSQIARSFQGFGKYPGIDRFKDIMLKKGTVLYSGFPGQTAFYTSAGAMRRSGGSAGSLYDGLQIALSKNYPMRTRMAAYEVMEDTPAAFGLAINNTNHGAGWLPQVVVPSYETSLRLLGVSPLGP